MIDNKNNIENFFNELSLIYNIIKQKDIEIEKLTSKKFSIFKYIKFNEDKFSDILADILNPESEHGQGDTFLRAFISILEINLNKKDYNYPNIIREAYTKQSINTLRRMDILIDWGDFGIMIENKPKHKDEPNQLIDYYTDLKNKYNNDRFIIVFMSKSNRYPSENSLPKKLKDTLTKDKQYFHFNYENHFVNWINLCILDCKSERYRWFLKDFKKYVTSKYLKQ